MKSRITGGLHEAGFTQYKFKFATVAGPGKLQGKNAFFKGPHVLILPYTQTRIFAEKGSSALPLPRGLPEKKR